MTLKLTKETRGVTFFTHSTMLFSILCVPFSICAILHNEGATNKSVWSLHLGVQSSLNVVHDHCKHNESKNLKASELVITRCRCLLYINLSHTSISFILIMGNYREVLAFYKSLNAYSLSLCI